MESATITTRTLEIDGMSGDACVQKVTGALKGVSGVTTQSVKVGSANIGANQNGCEAACTAINAAGFKAHQGACTPAASNGAAQPSHKPANQQHSPNQNPAHDKSADTNSGNTGKQPAGRPSGYAPNKPPVATN
jgi:copper chaperone CopZ